MALKEIKESVRAFRAEHLDYRLLSVELIYDNGDTGVQATWRRKLKSTGYLVAVRNHGIFSHEEKNDFFEWFRGLK